MATIIFTSLMQSLWLGLFLAATISIVLLTTRNKAPQLRYKLLTACLFLFAAAMAFVIIAGISAMISGNAQCVNSNGDIIPGKPLLPATIFTINNSIFVTGLSKYSSYIVWAWLAIAIARSLQMAVGLHRIHLLRRTEVYSTGKWWQMRVNELSTQLGIDRTIGIMQSGLTRVPVVIGYLKPLILLPVGLINDLPVAEVEAIICHELAHIRRKDYLVNLLQSVMEVLFFFNPAVLWLNRLIRKEREHCCDDIALAANVNLQDYIRALLSCREYQLGGYNHAMAFAGNKNSLLQRVKRMAGEKTSGTGTKGKVLLVLLVCVTISAAVLFSGTDGQRTHTTRIWIESPEMNKEIKTIDAPPAKCVSIAPDRQEKEKSEEEVSTNEPNIDPVVQPDDVSAPADQPEAPDKEAFTEADGDNMKEELRTDGIISNTVNTRYEINEQKLVVNDIAQPEQVHKKYYNKYLRYPGRAVTYNYTYKGN